MEKPLILLSVILICLPSTICLLLQTPSHLVQQLGSTFQINCALSNNDSSLSVTNAVQDLMWYFKGEKLPDNMYTAINDTTSQLTLDNVTLDEAGNYSCLLEGPQMETVAMSTTYVQLGTLPGIANFSCVCYNMADMWCTWDEVNSYLPTQFEFTWKLHFSSEWTPCPDTTEKGPNSCFFDFYANLGSLHHMKVNATNSLGSTYQTVWFNPDVETIPYPPEHLQVIPKSPHSLQIKWEPPTDWYASIFFLQYKLQYCSEWEPGNWSKLDKINTQQHYRVSGLEPNTLYLFRISCKPTGADGYWSAWSETGMGRTKEAAPDEGVQLYIAGETMKGENTRDVTMAWMLPPVRERNGVILGFQIIIQDESDRTNGNTTILDNGNATMHTFEDLDAYKSYYVTVRAFNSAGGSHPKSCRILDKISAPGEPEITEVKALSEDSVTVVWEPPHNPKGVLKEYILVYQNAQHHKEWNWISVDSNVHSYTITNLEAFVQYEFKVQAKNIVGYGGFSPTVSQYTLEGVPTGSPTNLTLQPNLHDPTSLTASWKAPCLDDRNGVIRMYTLQFCQYQEVHSNDNDDNSTVIPMCRGADAHKVNITVIDPTALAYLTRAEQHYLMRGLKSNTQYAVSVLAFTSQGQGPATDFVLGKTTMGAPEKIPENMKVQSSSLSDSTMTVEWSPLVGVNSDMVHYEMEVKTMNNSEHCGGIQVLRTNNTEMTIQDLCGYEMYGVVVRACTNADIEVQCGTYSQPVFVTTHIGAPTSPVDVEAVPVGDSKVEVIWSPPQRPNGPVSGLQYSIACFNGGDEAMTNEVLTSETDVVIDVDCDGRIRSDNVRALCVVTPISVLEVMGDPAQTDQILVCYQDPVWLYIVTPIAAVVVVIIAVIVSRKWFKFIKKKGFFDKVGHPTPFWEEEPTYQDHITYTDGLNEENYDNISFSGLVDVRTEVTAASLDTVSTHSSDHGVVIDSGRSLIGNNADRQSLSENVDSEEIAVMNESSPQEDCAVPRFKRLSSTIEDYQQVGEDSGELVLQPEDDKAKMPDDPKDYSALAQKGGCHGFQAKSLETSIKGKMNGSQAHKFIDEVGKPSAELTNLNVCHAVVGLRQQGTDLQENVVNEGKAGNSSSNNDAIMCSKKEKEKEEERKKLMKKGEAVWKRRSTGTSGSDPGSSIGDYSEVVGNDSSDSNGSENAFPSKFTPSVLTQDYQPLEFISGPLNSGNATPVNNRATPDTMTSDLACDASDSEDVENTVPLLDSNRGQQKPTTSENSSGGQQTTPFKGSNVSSVGLSSKGEEDHSVESEPLVSPNVTLDNGYVPNDEVTLQGMCFTADLKQTRV
ncbi:uncharacterized protein LOC144436643 isoform X2 [Glandiceps talaboti]